RPRPVPETSVRSQRPRPVPEASAGSRRPKPAPWTVRREGNAHTGRGHLVPPYRLAHFVAQGRGRKANVRTRLTDGANRPGTFLCTHRNIPYHTGPRLRFRSLGDLLQRQFISLVVCATRPARR